MELAHVNDSPISNVQSCDSCTSESELHSEPEMGNIELVIDFGKFKGENVIVYSKTRAGLEFNLECKETNWRLIFATGGVCFLSALESAAVGMSEWPYMSTIDPAATSQFYGMISSVYTTGHAIFAIIFSAIYYNYHSVKFPLIIGRLFAFVGCVAYLCVEWMPSNRKYLMMCCYFIFGIATSSAAVLRMYIIEISTKDDRARAFAIIIVANLLAVIIGPIIQLCFSGISYPGTEIFYNIRFHIFSAPIWIALVLNLVSVAVISVVMKPVNLRSTQMAKGNFISRLSISNLKKKFNEVRKSDACWPLILLCVIQKFMHIPTNSVVIIMAPFVMMAFDWGRESTVIYSAIALAVVGVLSFAVAALMMTPTIGRIPPRWIYLASVCLPLAMYIISYPYSATSHPIPAYNETTGTGCNSAEYSWCDGALATSQFAFLPLVIIVISLVIPLCAISIDTIYSKIFGNMDQTIMQGAMVAIGDIVGILGPIYSTIIFTNWGQGPLWIIDGVFTVVACLLWIVGFPKLKEYE